MENYKKIAEFIFLMFMLVSCADKINKPTEKQFEEKISVSKTNLAMSKLSKLYVVGNFDGEGKIDTLFQHTFSKKTNAEIILAPNPFKNDWEEVEKWFYNQDAEVTLSFNVTKKEVLHLGIAQGLYCLINVGDINRDGKDEVAFVVDFLDQSRVNNCKIYSYCYNKWELVKQFGVLEDAFDFDSKVNKSPIFNEIKEYLEKKNGIWLYKDYNEKEYDNPEDVGKLLPLKVEKCDAD